MLFQKKYENIILSDRILTLDIHYETKGTKEQYELLSSYELKKYNFNIKNTVYTRITICEKNNVNFNKLLTCYPQLKPYKSNYVKQIKVYINMDMPCLMESLLEHNMTHSAYGFHLSSLSITFNVHALNTKYLKPFANKKHKKTTVYKIDTDLSQICIYNSDVEKVSATGITSINNALLLRSVVDVM
jgi:hypothetical protein